jgi:hypothetical protein
VGNAAVQPTRNSPMCKRGKWGVCRLRCAPSLKIYFMDIIEMILDKLPAVITVDGVSFFFCIDINTNDMQLSYDIYTVDKDSLHYKSITEDKFWMNPFIAGGAYPCDFLYLKGGIMNLAELEQAVVHCIGWLIKNNLICS